MWPSKWIAWRNRSKESTAAGTWADELFFPFHKYLNHILDGANFYYVDGAHAVCFQILHFTALLIEHSFTRHLYSSMEHLSTLLASSDMTVVLAVLNLLYVFSKRSNFITRFSGDKKQLLVDRLTHLAEVIHHVAYTRKTLKWINRSSNCIIFTFYLQLCFILAFSLVIMIDMILNICWQSWGGKENGFGLAECCQNLQMSVCMMYF